MLKLIIFLSVLGPFSTFAHGLVQCSGMTPSHPSVDSDETFDREVFRLELPRESGYSFFDSIDASAKYGTSERNSYAAGAVSAEGLSLNVTPPKLWIICAEKN